MSLLITLITCNLLGIHGVDTIPPCPTTIDLYVNDECEAILPDYSKTVLASDSLEGQISQVPPAGTLLESPDCKVELISEVGDSNSILCEFWVLKRDTSSISISPLFDDTLYLNELGRIDVPDYTDSFLVNSNCELIFIRQDLSPGLSLDYSKDVSIIFYFSFKNRSFSESYTFSVVDTLDLLQCQDGELYLDEEGVTLLDPAFFSEDTVDFLELFTPEGVSLISLFSGQLNEPVDLQLCEQVGETLHLQMQDSAGRSCESRIKIKVGSFFSQPGRVFDFWCPAFSRSALAFLEQYPVKIELPCAVEVELSYIADWINKPECDGDTLQFIYREFELRNFVNKGIYFDTIVFFNSVPFSLENLYCPATVTMASTELNSTYSKGLGPMYVYSESATDQLLDIDNDADYRDTLFFIEYIDIDSSQTINNSEEIRLSYDFMTISKDCGFKATLHSEKIDGVPCHQEFRIVLDLVQECTGRDSETSFQDLDLENNAFEQIDSNHWRAIYLLKDTSQINLPISCDQVSIADKSISDSDRQFVKTPPSIEFFSPGRTRFVDNALSHKLDDYYHLRCYPNPTKGHAMMEFQLIDEEMLTLSIFNSIGQIISSYSSRFGKGWHLLDVSKDLGTSSGVYYLKLQGNQFYSVQHIVKM